MASHTPRWFEGSESDDTAWLAHHASNRPADLERQLWAEHFGEIAAWRLDGSGVYCVGPTIEAVRDKLQQQGLRLRDALIEQIGDPDGDDLTN